MSFSGDNRLSDLLFQAGLKKVLQPGSMDLRNESRAAADLAGRN
jgi:hypothetical protein